LTGDGIAGGAEKLITFAMHLELNHTFFMNLHTELNIRSALLIGFILLLNGPLGVTAQDSIAVLQDSTAVQPGTPYPERDLPDVIRGALHKPPKVKAQDAGSLMLLPIIGSNPATGFMFGVGGQYAFKVPAISNYSLISGSIQYTTKNQFIFMLKNNIYTENNRIFFSGDWRFLIFSQSTYGLGTTSPEGGILDFQFGLAGAETSSDSLSQPMTFNFGRLHQSVMFELLDGIYLGLGYQFDSYFKIVDEKLSLGTTDSLLTSHYAYNTYYGFDTEKYINSTIGLRFVIDKRDNMIQPYKGYYFSVNWQGGFRFTGNDRNSNLYQVEWRSFHGLSKRNPTHLLAFWLMGDFAEEGSLPYMILPATAYDQRGRSARGYTQGRFRGNQMVYGEVEYRFPLSQPGGVLGGVLFANATTANNPFLELNLFESVKPSAGFGLRVKLDKYSRTNLAADLAFGQQSSGFYLAVSETF
jgi:outer membrane protein assembly factor BamA